MQFKYDVFVSHASEDREVAMQIVEAVKADNAWLDSFRIGAGESLTGAISMGIAESKYFVVVISKSSLKSEWVGIEFGICIGLKHINSVHGYPVVIGVLHGVSVSEAKKRLCGNSDMLFLTTNNGKRVQCVGGEIVDVLKKGMPSIVVGISGASCSGKTWFSKKLQKKIPEYTCSFGLDGYYRDSDFVNSLPFRHDDPSAIDYPLAWKALDSLKSGNTTNVQEYDMRSERVTGEKVVAPAPVIIVEGLFVFNYPAIRELCDVKVWLDANSAVRLKRRILRDTSEERERSIEEVLRRYEENVVPGYERHIKPFRSYADIHIPNCGPDTDRGHIMVDLLVSHIESVRRRIKGKINFS